MANAEVTPAEAGRRGERTKELTPIQQVHVKLHTALVYLRPGNFLDMGDYLHVTEDELKEISTFIEDAVNLLRQGACDDGR